MKNKSGIIMAVLFCLVLAACSRRQSEVEPVADTSGTAAYSGQTQDQTYPGEEVSLLSGAIATEPNIGGVISSGAAVFKQGDSTRKLIRTADLKFRVKDVPRATVQIEDLAASVGGFIIRTNLKSNVFSTETTPLSEDSVLETTNYGLSGSILLRVPAPKLDTTLKALVPMIEFLDYRHIRVRDVELEIKANDLRKKRHRDAAKAPLPKPDKKTVIANKDVTLNFSACSVEDAQDSRFRHHTDADQAELDNLSLEDQVRYSTVTIEIYDRLNHRRTVLANERNIEAYKPGAAQRIGTAFGDGWGILVAVLEFIARIWGLILMAALVIAGITLYNKRFKKKNTPQS